MIGNSELDHCLPFFKTASYFGVAAGLTNLKFDYFNNHCNVANTFKNIGINNVFTGA